MEKEIRDFKIDYDLHWSYGVSIDEIQEDIDKLRALGCTHIDIEACQSYDVPYISFEPISRRIETDEECEQRLAEKKAWQEELVRRDMQQYEMLKKKLGL